MKVREIEVYSELMRAMGNTKWNIKNEVDPHVEEVVLSDLKPSEILAAEENKKMEQEQLLNLEQIDELGSESSDNQLPTHESEQPEVD